MTKLPERPMPKAREHLAGGTPWRERLPNASLERGMEGGAIYSAETDDGFWVVLDEGTMAAFLDPEDAALAGVTLELYATAQGRDDAIAWRLPPGRR